MFSHNNRLQYTLSFSQKLSISVCYKLVSYLRDFNLVYEKLFVRILSCYLNPRSELSQGLVQNALMHIIRLYKPTDITVLTVMSQMNC